MKIMVINGPNLNMLGIREPSVYGKRDYNTLVELIEKHAREKKIECVCKQSNHEGEIIDIIQSCYFDGYDGIVINPGGYTHTSVAILDALKAVSLPTAEVHISNIDERESFRAFSYVSLYAQIKICGKGFDGYIEGIDKLCEFVKNIKKQ